MSMVVLSQLLLHESQVLHDDEPQPLVRVVVVVNARSVDARSGIDRSGIDRSGSSAPPSSVPPSGTSQGIGSGAQPDERRAGKRTRPPPPEPARAASDSSAAIAASHDALT